MAENRMPRRSHRVSAGVPKVKCYRPLERPVRMDEAPAVDAGFWIGLRNVAIGLLILWLFGMLMALWIVD